MTRKDHLVQLVAAVLARPSGVKRMADDEGEFSQFVYDSSDIVIEEAANALREIEEHLGEARSEDGRTVGNGPTSSKNARLISAAPDLLEALQDLTTQIRVDEQEDCLHLLLDSVEYKAALSAIAKATGEGA